MSTAMKNPGTAADLAKLRETLNLAPKSPVIDVAMWVGQYPFREDPSRTGADFTSRRCDASSVSR